MAKRNTYFEDEIVMKKIDVKQLLKVFRYICPFKKTVILAVSLMLFSAGISMVSPLLLKQIINVVVVREDYRMLALVVSVMVFLVLLDIGITFVHQLLSGIMGQGVIASIRQDIFYKLQRLPFDYFDSRPDGKIVIRVTDYINDLANFFANYLVQLLVYIAKIFIVTFFMLSISLALTGAVFLTVLPMMACVFYLRHCVGKIFPRHRAKMANRTAFLVETIMGEKIVKSYNRSELNREIYKEIHQTSVDTWLRIVRRIQLNTPIVELFWNLGTLLLYGLALLLILKGNAGMDAGTVVVFTSYMSLFSGPLTQIAYIIQQLAQVSSNLEQVFDTIDYPLEIPEEENARNLSHIKGKVDFNHVTFQYEEGIPVLTDFNLHVKPGETIALVGPTGVGKTTIINLLTRFYDVTCGEVKIDGMNVKQVSLHSLRKEVGVLMQDPFIFKGTILENIRYGRPDATDRECMEAAELIHAQEHILQMKDGYYHMLDERGQGLSAGEKQLISFARIVLKNPSVIILDEATSSIDTETEQLIKEALDTILAEKTAFIVAHRLSTIRNADRILYIMDGEIKEQGNHEELMALKGYYYSMQ
ncbi:MAG: ABC transporter ATP-binding protein/permease [Lachnospiraceae bacterium]|nr:ABC transporter ATP-binding protein/permease [Lachnospiraceae bacterium]